MWQYNYSVWRIATLWQILCQVLTIHIWWQIKYILIYVTCCKAALASNASVGSLTIDTSAVGVPWVETAAGERRGVDVRENSSDGAP